MSSDDSAEIEVLTLRHLPELVAIMDKVYQTSKVPIGGMWNRDLLKQELEIGQGVGLRSEHFGLGGLCALSPLRQCIVKSRFWPLIRTASARATCASFSAICWSANPPVSGFGLRSMPKMRPRLWALYASLGFQEVGRRPKYYRDGGDAVLFTLG